jgi:hypothetical protein
MFSQGAEDFQKRPGRELNIPEKVRYGLETRIPAPTNNHQKLPRWPSGSYARAEKSPAQELKIFKKEQIDS